MCLLTFLPAGVRPDEDALARGTFVNNDGHGFAIVAGNRLIVHRGMHADEVIAEFARQRGRHPSGPALFHSRFATHGTVSKHNTHPFTVGGDKHTVLAHNGILPKTVHPGLGDSRSDTRIAAEDVLPASGFASFDRPATRARIERWLGTGNKVVILTVNPRYRTTAYLFNEDGGVWDNGIWYSNTDYQPDTALPASAWWPLDGGCVVCGNISVDHDSGLCQFCEHCPFCGSENGNCPRYCYRILGEFCSSGCGDFAHLCGCDVAPANQMN
jgi:glutamine amidotransferase